MKSLCLHRGANQQSIAYMFNACLHTSFRFSFCISFGDMKTPNWKRANSSSHIKFMFHAIKQNILNAFESFIVVCLTKIQRDHDNEKEKKERKKH